jgi:PAS domain S-box-containing protein
MRVFRDLSIKRKLTLIIMLVSGVASLLACGAFILYDQIAARHAMEMDLSTQAKMIATNSTAALTFNDQKDGQEILSALAAKPEIISAYIYATDHKPFAFYRRIDQKAELAPPQLQAEGSYFGKDNLVVFHRIGLDGEMIGTVYLESDLQELRSRLQRYIWIMTIIMAASMFVALLLSARLQRVISGPIVHLAQTAKVVSTEKNYALRAETRNRDELGVLIDGFNEMLGQIQKRDEELQQRNEALQDEIAERHRIEQELRESEKRLLDLFENSPDAIFVEDMNGNVVAANTAACQLHGLERENLIGKHFNELVPPEMREQVAENFKKQIKNEQQQVESFSWTADGRAVPIELRVRHMNYRGQPVLLFHARDITERKQAEETKAKLERQLRQSQKMEAIGTLAGGIAHDFNNILAAIMGYSELALMDLEGNVAAGRLQEVLKASRRAKELVRQILTFSRQEEHERKPLKLQPIIEEALKLLRASLPSSIEIRQHTDPAIPSILGDATQIHQVMMNLGTNAWHAMNEQGGVLEIILTTVAVDADFADAHPGLQPGPHIRLVVRDTGCGMERAELDRIFEPFFTTKAPGAGTGLGLAVVHGVVKRHEGAISVYSEPGKGTTFNIYWPVHDGEAKSGPQESQVVPKGQGEHILLVDDEEPLAALGKSMLERLGYRVTTEVSSVEALKTFSLQPRDFDLVITDQTMPNMSGVELAKVLLEIRPELPVILATGYSTAINAEKAQAMGIREMLLKPSTAQSLAEAIRRALGTNGKDRLGE